MLIEDKRKDRDGLTFDDLYIGDAFEYYEESEDKQIWVKCGDEVALSLNDDVVEDFSGWAPVRKVNVRVIIED